MTADTKDMHDPALNIITGELYRIDKAKGRILLKLWQHVYVNIDVLPNELRAIHPALHGEKVTVHYIIPHDTGRAELVNIEFTEVADHA